MMTCWKVKAYHVNVNRISCPQTEEQNANSITDLDSHNVKTEVRLEKSPNFDHNYRTHLLLSAYLLISTCSLPSSCLHAVSN